MVLMLGASWSMVAADLEPMADSDNSALDGIAVIGMAGRFPGARSPDEFWQNLCQGRETISRFTDEELLAAGVSPELLGNPNYVKAGARLENAECFDAGFFGYLPREAEMMDPQHRLFLQCAWEALENAGYDPSQCPGAVGVFGGCGQNSYLLNNLCTNPRTRPLATDFTTMLGNDKDFLAVRVAYKLNLKGPAVTVQTACSTSLVAVVHAWQALQGFQCDVALAGGAAVHAPQVEGYLYREGMILSPDGHCRAFDARAQGTVSGTGVGLVVLKRLADALEAGDQILAVIRGAATNNDGSLKVGFTAPSVEGQAECIATAQTLADVPPDTISYIETHGTGTPLGDPIEIAALTQAFRAQTDKKQFCAIGSLKPSIGHADAAAGVAGLMKLVLALHHKKIPASLHFEEANPKIDFANSPFFVNTQLKDWKPGRTPRRAGVSSFGIGGTNAHCVLEEAPEPISVTATSSRPVQLLVWSTRNEGTIDEATANLAAHFKGVPDLSLADAAYTLQTGRKAFAHRRALVCRNVSDAQAILSSGDPRRWIQDEARMENPPVVFLFPGQGAQFVRMGEELYRTEPVFRKEVDTCSEYLLPLLGLDLRKTLYPDVADEAAARSRIHETRIAQPAIFTLEYALARLWMSWGVQPAALVGHSIGEYVAAVLAGVFALDEALKLLAMRAQLMQSLPGGSMLAVKLPAGELEPLLAGKTLSVAAANSPSLTVVSGPTAAIEELRELLSQRKVASKALSTSHAFHSAMIDPILSAFTEQVRKTRRSAPRIPMMSTLTAKWFSAGDAADAEYWSRQMRESVRFVDAMQEVLSDPHRIVLEVGPGQTLTPFVRQHPGKRATQLVIGSLHPTQEANQDCQSMLAALGRLWSAGVSVDWTRFSSGESRRRVALPTYPFERIRHWVEPGARSEPALSSATGEARSIFDPVHSPSVTVGIAAELVGDDDDSAAVERLMAEQLEVMRQQLDLLKSGAE